MKCLRPSLLLRVSPPNTWRAFQGSAGRPLRRSLVATFHVLGVTSRVLSTLRFVAPVVAVALLPISRLLALRAAVLRLAVSQLAPPGTAAHFSAQTLGITVGRHAFAPTQPSLRFERNALALLCFFGRVHQILRALFKAAPFGSYGAHSLLRFASLESSRGFFPHFGLWHWCWLLLVIQSGGCWRFAPQCCAWRSVRGRRRVRLLISQPSRQRRRSSGKVGWRHLVCRQWAVCQRVMPNSSIERTNNGGSQLRAFANAQPPLFASHLKR
jgi:hypothetical protein